MTRQTKLVGLGLAAVVILLLAIIAASTVMRFSAITDKSQPTGIWSGLISDLPSGRSVECVFARDAQGGVAITCDWNNAVIVR